MKLVRCDVSMGMLVKHRSTPALQVTWLARHREFIFFGRFNGTLTACCDWGVYGYVCMHKKYTLSLYIYYIPYYIYNYICIYGLPSQTCVIGEIRVGSWPVVLHVVSVCFYLRHRVLFIFRFDGRGSVAVGFPGVHLCTIYMVAFVHQGSQTAQSITRRWQNQVCSFKTFSSWGTWQGV